MKDTITIVGADPEKEAEFDFWEDFAKNLLARTYARMEYEEQKENDTTDESL